MKVLKFRPKRFRQTNFEILQSFNHLNCIDFCLNVKLNYQKIYKVWYPLNLHRWFFRYFSSLSAFPKIKSRRARGSTYYLGCTELLNQIIHPRFGAVENEVEGSKILPRGTALREPRHSTINCVDAN